MRLIDADALLQSLDKKEYGLSSWEYYVKQAQTIDPVKHGRWIVDDWTGLIVCEQCGLDAPMSTITGQQYESEYCQTCGARMDGGKE